MYKSLKYLISIPSEKSYTHYFFNSSDKFVLAIDGDPNPLDPNSSDTINRVVKAFGGTIKSIKIFLCIENKYYVYLSVEKDGKIADIYCSVEDAMEIQKMLKIPIYIEDIVLNQQGIKVTLDMIERSLSQKSS